MDIVLPRQCLPHRFFVKGQIADKSSVKRREESLVSDERYLRENERNWEGGEAVFSAEWSHCDRRAQFTMNAERATSHSFPCWYCSWCRE